MCIRDSSRSGPTARRVFAVGLNTRAGSFEVGMGLPLGFDAASAYRAMVRMRLVEEALAQAWADGLVPGEYHSGIGEEGINAGVLSHLSGRDSMALDHRNTLSLIHISEPTRPY